MKKTIILAGFALMAAFSSCNKSEMPEAATSDGIKLNITVADLSPETKAVKSGWVNGDRLNLYFEGWNESATSDNYQKEPDMILKYDGSKWQIESQVASLSSRLKESGGKFSAFWESSNDLKNYKYFEWATTALYHSAFTTKNAHTSDKYVCHANLYVTNKDDIAYSYDGSTLTAKISSWDFLTRLKILVKTENTAVKDNANNLVLQVKIGDNSYAWPTGDLVGNQDLGIKISSSNVIGMQGAVAESDGLAFYYQDLYATSSQIVFTLIDTSNGNKKQYTVTGKSLKTDTFKAISIDYSQFKDVE